MMMPYTQGFFRCCLSGKSDVSIFKVCAAAKYRDPQTKQKPPIAAVAPTPQEANLAPEAEAPDTSTI